MLHYSVKLGKTRLCG